MEGTIAQLVEQRTENPCVAGSNPAGTTDRIKKSPVNVELAGFFIANPLPQAVGVQFPAPGLGESPHPYSCEKCKNRSQCYSSAKAVPGGDQ